jgi:hypothetical protein
MAYRIRLACAALLFALAAPSPILCQELTITAGGLYAVGRYGGTDTTKAAISFVTAQASHSGWEITATLPYLSAKSEGQLIEVGGILLPRQGGRVRGFGDVLVNIERPLKLGGRLPINVSLGGRIKLPTGANGISTGRFDYGVDAELSRTIGQVTPFAKAGYRWYGDSPALELSNGWEGSAGARVTLGKAAVVASYDWSESAFGGSTSKAAYGLVSLPLAQRWRWIAFGSKGLSAGAPDTLIGLGVTRSF